MKMVKSRFDAIVAVKASKKASTKRTPSAPPAELGSVRDVTVKRKQGKRSMTGYVQRTAYIPKKVYDDVRIKLIRDGRDYSDLVEDLLIRWLKEK